MFPNIKVVTHAKVSKAQLKRKSQSLKGIDFILSCNRKKFEIYYLMYHYCKIQLELTKMLKKNSSDLPEKCHRFLTNFSKSNTIALPWERYPKLI